jgi:hypothetical protein
LEGAVALAPTVRPADVVGVDYKLGMTSGKPN